MAKSIELNVDVTNIDEAIEKARTEENKNPSPEDEKGFKKGFLKIRKDGTIEPIEPSDYKS